MLTISPPHSPPPPPCQLLLELVPLICSASCRLPLQIKYQNLQNYLTSPRFLFVLSQTDWLVMSPQSSADRATGELDDPLCSTLFIDTIKFDLSLNGGLVVRIKVNLSHFCLSKTLPLLPVRQFQIRPGCIHIQSLKYLIVLG